MAVRVPPAPRGDEDKRRVSQIAELRSSLVHEQEGGGVGKSWLDTALVRLGMALLTIGIALFALSAYVALHSADLSQVLGQGPVDGSRAGGIS